MVLQESREMGMAALVALLAVMLRESVPDDVAFMGEVNVSGFFYQRREADCLQLDLARRAGIKRLFVPKMTGDGVYSKERLPPEFRGEREVVGVATVPDLIEFLWPRLGSRRLI
jgi:predicted ATP-dependent serine protease